MIILALDTCLGAVSVALRYEMGQGELVIREDYEERQTGHAERLFPMMASVLAGAGRTARDIDRLAVTIGPGTFTGIRVGVAAARGLALATGKPVVAVSSLEVMARRARFLLGERAAGRPLAVLVDARRSALYAAIYAPNARCVLMPPSLMTSAQAVERVRAHEAIAVGSGSAVVVADAATGGATIDSALPHLEPQARFLAEIASERPPSDRIEPLYLREPDVRPQPPPVPRLP